MVYKNIELHNIEEIIWENDSSAGGDISAGRLCRLPDELRRRVNPGAQGNSFQTAGAEVRFCLNSDEAAVLLKIPNQGMTGSVEVYHGCFQEKGLRFIDSKPTEIVVKKPSNLEVLKRLSMENQYPFAPEVVRIKLPYNCPVSLIDVRGDISLPRPEQKPRLKWLAYGSSITHGSSAFSPSGTYVEKAALRLGADCFNFGFAGSALLDAPMADYIAARKDWDFATLELGANMIWDVEANTWASTEIFRERVDYFVSKIAESNPDKWIFCIDLFTNNCDFGDNRKAIEFRNVVREKVQTLNMPKVRYIYGKDMLTSPRGLSTDLIHPSAEGMEEISANLARVILEAIKI